MTDLLHKFKIGQIVDLIPTTFRFAAKGHYEIVRLIPIGTTDPQYCIKSKDEIHQRIVSEGDLILSEHSDSVFS